MSLIYIFLSISFSFQTFLVWTQNQQSSQLVQPHSQNWSRSWRCLGIFLQVWGGTWWRGMENNQIGNFTLLVLNMFYLFFQFEHFSVFLSAFIFIFLNIFNYILYFWVFSQFSLFFSFFLYLWYMLFSFPLLINWYKKRYNWQVCIVICSWTGAKAQGTARKFWVHLAGRRTGEDNPFMTGAGEIICGIIGLMLELVCPHSVAWAWESYSHTSGVGQSLSNHELMPKWTPLVRSLWRKERLAILVTPPS